MPAVTFDTHKFVRTLKNAGFDEKQAEAVSDAFKDAQSEADLATRGDLREMEHRIINKLMMTMAALSVFTATAGVSFVVWFIEKQ